MFQRLQLSVHRLLQRAFAQLFSYKMHSSSSSSESAATLYDETVLLAENTKDLHYKMKGASNLVTLYHVLFSFIVL